jgi:hypothetical protein
MSMLQENSGLSYSMVVSMIGLDRIWELLYAELQARFERTSCWELRVMDSECADYRT